MTTVSIYKTKEWAAYCEAQETAVATSAAYFANRNPTTLKAKDAAKAHRNTALASCLTAAARAALS